MVSLIITLFLPLSTQSLFAAAPITNGLLVSLDAISSNISGSTWSPADGTSYSATLQSSSMYTSPNNYVTFGDNTNQYADFGNIGSYSGDISGETWVYVNSMHTGGWNIIASKWFTGSTEDWHFGYYLGALRICYRGVCPAAALSQNQTAAGAWHHVAFTFKQPTSGLCSSTETGGLVTLYMDGVQVAQDSGAGACHPTSSSMLFVIGDKRATANLGLDAKVAKFRFYTRLLSGAEISKVFRAEASNFSIAAAPYLTVSPTYSGSSAKVGIQQNGLNGTWLNSPTSYSYRWYRSATTNGTYTAIIGANAQNYTATSADLNQYLKFEVTASNSSGSTVETSTATQILQGMADLTLSGITNTTNSNSVRNLSVSPGVLGKVTFYGNGKKIAKCIALPTNASNGYMATCPWKPPVVGYVSVYAVFTSADAGYSSGQSTTLTSFIVKRPGRR